MKDCRAKGKFGKQYEACSQMVGGSPCGRRHNRLLHGTGNKYCNSARKISNCNHSVPHLLGKGEPGAPTMKEIAAVDAAHSLFQLQEILIDNESVDRVSTFFDSGSNVNIVRECFAKKAGLKGQPVLQTLVTTGEQVKEWRTKATRSH